MVQLFKTAAVAALALISMLAMAVQTAQAEDKMPIPQGAKAVIHGTSAMINNGGGGNGVTASVDCKCTGEGGGECMLTSGGSSLICSNGPPGAKECKGACILIVSTTGVMGVGPAAAKGASGGSPAGAGAVTAKPKQ